MADSWANKRNGKDEDWELHNGELLQGCKGMRSKIKMVKEICTMVN
jgi:hypothetical protein